MSSSNSDVYEFPEDNKIVQTNLADYTTELLDGNSSTTKSTISDDPPNQLFLTSLLSVGSAAFFLTLSASVVRFSPFLGSILSISIILIFREWNRIYGGLLTPRLKASINYSTVLKDNKEYIPFYDMDWLFGGKYKPYCYGCTGPAINPDMCRTPDDPDSRSPTKERNEGEKLMKNS
ncbi:Protein CBG01719 [Caenorhabditis briggsae]|uniref:Uncharacterized protein n=2 Tax=Caenorhabditis briggsae TaxID=6238 RepID=A0AAE9EWJ8_CAEBR|nr:Protein CBG01719 [Caenorhabditis briggsae]ULT96372.1 hypothetical protein L3Y34_004762 [Caenorhabditis briggsae]UMM29559.1 hypothetical protein L5515_011861 [Caenorhabditis briggsae]CAP22912.1 Protein CBG01719 [Caenorhabditis briggsae]